MRKGCGTITGCDSILEWILPWWWFHYKQLNTLPVAFIDFGMSEKAKIWCRERGDLIALPYPDFFAAPKEKIPASLAHSWEQFYGNNFWNHRNAWFKKVFAAAASPFQNSVWIDIDCEVAADISCLTSLCENSAGFSIPKETQSAQEESLRSGLILPGETFYSCGVFSFTAHSPILPIWQEMSLHANHEFISEQTLLSRIISKHSFAVHEMSSLYNWHMKLGDHADVKIKHWAGSWGKEQIALSIELLKKMSVLFQLDHFDA